MTRARRSTSTSTQPCPRCGAPTITQTVGHTAALTVTVALPLAPLTPAEQERIRGPNTLPWCAHQLRSGGTELRWLDPWHSRDCPHPHVAPHHCTAPRPPVQPTLFPQENA